MDNFPSYFSFYWAICKYKKSKEVYLYKIDKIFLNTLIDPTSIIVVLDASIKNNIATSISHIHSYSNDIKKTILPTLHWLRCNYLPSDVGLIKLFKFLKYSISLSSPMLFILWRESLILWFILINCNWYL